MRELNIALWQTIVDHWEGGHIDSNYSSFMEEYLRAADSLEDDE